MVRREGFEPVTAFLLREVPPTSWATGAKFWGLAWVFVGHPHAAARRRAATPVRLLRLPICPTRQATLKEWPGSVPRPRPGPAQLRREGDVLGERRIVVRICVFGRSREPPRAQLDLSPRRRSCFDPAWWSRRVLPPRPIEDPDQDSAPSSASAELSTAAGRDPGSAGRLLLSASGCSGISVTGPQPDPRQ